MSVVRALERTSVLPPRGTLNGGCATKRLDLESPRRVQVQPLAERRRRRLSRGVDRWIRDVRSDRAPARVQLLTLTVKLSDPLAAEGAVRALFHEMRQLRGEMRYFWWAEFQRRGAIHFHAILLDSPFRNVRRAKSWIGRHWRLSPLWPVVLKRDPGWFDEKAGAYVGAYAKKSDGPKSYQHSFELMPKGWHVFACTRLAFPLEEHQEHEHQVETAHTGDSVIFERNGRFRTFRSLDDWWIYAVRYHQPAPGGCRLDPALRRVTKRKGSVTKRDLPVFGASWPDPVPVFFDEARRESLPIEVVAFDFNPSVNPPVSLQLPLALEMGEGYAVALCQAWSE